MFDPAEIQRLILAGLPCEHVHVESDDGTHFHATVVSTAFAGLSRVRQHKAVYDTLGALLGNEIHALQLATYTPDAWQQACANS